MGLGSADQLIAIPKGGGALSGIGEKFSPDLHTGTGNYSIQLELPPGRNGFQPQLALTYSTGAGNGPFGLGWSLSLPSVSRKTSRGVPRYDDARDTYIISGSEDLVAVPGGPDTAVRYRPRTEGQFARIEHHREPGAGVDYWEVRTRDGLVSFYGAPGPAGGDPFVVADPADRARVFAWHLARTVDPFGNTIEYEYERDLVQDGRRAWDQVYLRRVRYADFADGGATRFLVSVSFDYGDPALERPDPFSDCRAGFEVRTRRRCRRVEVRTHADRERLIRTYHLTYLDERPELADLRARNGASLLSRVQVEGHDDEQVERLPPLDFAYTRFQPERRALFPITGPDLPPGSLARPELELVDLNGDGLPDVLEMNGSVRSWRNLGEGRLDRPRPMPDAPSVRLGMPGVQMLDADGDGRMDLLVTHPPLAGTYALDGDGRWDRQSFRAYSSAPSVALDDPEVRLLDLDGDGVIDALRSGARLECFLNDRSSGWQPPILVDRGALDVFPNVNFSDPRVRVADMNGDGLRDVVLVHDGNVEYWTSLGRGAWGPRISMRQAPRLPFGYDPARVLLGDVDGDGAADLLLVEDGQVTVWLNQSGNAWGEPIQILGTPSLAGGSPRLVDLLGSGTEGVLWSADAGGLARDHLVFLDLTGGAKPYLLSRIDNSAGGVTQVEYTSSSQEYLRDSRDPATRWRTSLPFPVQVVSRVTVEEAFSGSRLVSEYRYHHGCWDGYEREFRGFGRVDQLDAESLAGGSEARQAPPVETRTWFHQGPVDLPDGWAEIDLSQEYWVEPWAGAAADPLARPAEMGRLLGALTTSAQREAIRSLRGRVLRVETYARDGKPAAARPLTVTEHRHGVCVVLEEGGRPRLVGDGADLPAGSVPAVFFPYLAAERASTWERGDEPMTRFRFVGRHDRYGQPGLELAVAVPRGRDFLASLPADGPVEPYLATLSLSDRAQKDWPERFIVDRVCRTTSYEVANDGRSSVADLRALVEGLAQAGQPDPRLIVIGQTVTFFDGAAFEGLPYGQIGDHGAPMRAEMLVLTPERLLAAWPQPPPYLDAAGAAAWPSEYPAEWRARLPVLAGYRYQQAAPGSPYASGYFIEMERRRYDLHERPAGLGRGLVSAQRDQLGADVLIRYDGYDLLPIRVVDPVGLETTAVYDYRVLQPRLVTDANGTQREFWFSPLGLPLRSAVRGAGGEGDAPGEASTHYAYRLEVVLPSWPLAVRTTRRVAFAGDPQAEPEERDTVLETVEYLDGLGRPLQTRALADRVAFGDPVSGGGVLPAEGSDAAGAIVGRLESEDGAIGPRVVVSGWQRYDNKGHVVEAYEPFLAFGWEYRTPAAERDDFGREVLGQKVDFFYDALGRLERTVNPDGSELRTVYGALADLAKPDEVRPTPWERFSYDANDNAGRTHPGLVAADATHLDTPSSVVFDALGRVVERVERTGPQAANRLRTRTAYDLRGNVLRVVDPLGRTAFAYDYDLADRVWHTSSLDGGERQTVFDAAGRPVEDRDAKGALSLHAYDVLGRPSRVWARDGAPNGVPEPVTLRERLEYGDGGSPQQPPQERAQHRAANRLGRLWRHYDEAGLVTHERYDFRGGLTEKVRLVVRDGVLTGPFATPPPDWRVAPFRMDWTGPAGGSLADREAELLDPAEYRTSTSYDGLGRVRWLRCPADVVGRRRLLRSHYGRAGRLERVSLDGVEYVRRLAYDARGQCTLTVLGNGLMVRRAYDQRTFRLVRLRTERYTSPPGLPLELRPSAPNRPFQDLAYQYDLAGNLVATRDTTPGCGLPPQPDRLERAFSYDPLYRLRSATGREHEVLPPLPWADRPYQPDLHRARPYAETYSYDRAGNLERIQHAASNSFTRVLETTTDAGGQPVDNRLARLAGSSPGFQYAYDGCGNLTGEGSSRHFEWDQANRLRAFRTQAGAAEPSVQALYLYDGAGQRVKKLVRKQGGRVETAVYVDGVFEHHRWRLPGAAERQNSYVHLADERGRVALERSGPAAEGDPSPATQYQLGDHLGSCVLAVDETGTRLSREEFTPYGETSFGSFERKRYRFSGKERDEESGLAYHGARYYAPWLGRWTSCDPAGAVDGPNGYRYAAANPLRMVDPTGRQAEAAEFGGSTNLSGRRILDAIDEAKYRSEPLLEAGLDVGEVVYPPLEYYAALEAHYQGRELSAIEKASLFIPAIGKLKRVNDAKHLQRFLPLVSPKRVHWGAAELAEYRKLIRWTRSARSEVRGDAFARLATIALKKRYGREMANELPLISGTRIDSYTVVSEKNGIFFDEPEIIAEFKFVQRLSSIYSGNTSYQLPRQIEAAVSNNAVYEIVVGMETKVGKSLLDDLKRFEQDAGLVWRISRFNPETGKFYIWTQAAALE